MESKTDKYVLANGMVVLGEAMEGVESVAFDFLRPGPLRCLKEPAAPPTS